MSSMSYRRQRLFNFLLIIVVFVAAALYARPGGPDFNLKKWHRELRLHKGLDLVGGAQLVYQLQNNSGQSDTEAVDQVVEVMRLRVDALGVSEPVIQKAVIGTSPAIIVELPGIADPATARATIGDTAQLTFQTISGGVVVTGKDVKKASVVFDPTTQKPQVQLQFNPEGTAAFAQATAANIGQPILIVLDTRVISAPTVQTAITDGNAVITGIGDGAPSRTAAIAEVTKLARQINSGALPVPVKLVQERSVGATLGQDTVRNSIFAGIIGFTVIMLLMVVLYGWAGVVTSFTLIIYGLLMVLLIQAIPITVTLAGIAGFILSLGVTVDANVLIYERVREELRQGVEMHQALRHGFNKAWDSIRDANLSSVITASILFWFGTGPIRGFAVILILGVAVGIFCAVTLNRIIMEYLSITRFASKLVRP